MQRTIQTLNYISHALIKSFLDTYQTIANSIFQKPKIQQNFKCFPNCYSSINTILYHHSVKLCWSSSLSIQYLRKQICLISLFITSGCSKIPETRHIKKRRLFSSQSWKLKVQGQAAHCFYPGEDWLTLLHYVHEAERDMITYRQGQVCRVVSLYNNTVS